MSVITQPGNIFVDFFHLENRCGLIHACHLRIIIKERKSKDTINVLKFDQCKADLNAFLQGELGKSFGNPTESDLNFSPIPTSALNIFLPAVQY